MLKINESAPLQITVADQKGKSVSLKDLLGAPVVLYFYPKDDTPGCTREACEFRDYNSELQKLKVQVIGVSADSVVSHQKFSEKYALPFPLWSDPEKKLLEAFGAIGEKSMFGKKYIGIKRMTVALDENGTVIQIWQKVTPSTHAKEVVKFFKNRAL